MKKIYLILLSIFTLSCSDDDANSNQFLLKQVNENGITLSKYTYQNDLISTKKSYNSGQVIRTEKFEYSNDTVFIRNYNSSNELTITRKYYSISENISRRDRYNSNNEMTNYRVYTFSNNDCGFVNIDFYDNNNNLYSKSTFEYIDGNCSMQSINYDSNNLIASEEKWIRDDKNKYNKNELLNFFRADNLGNSTDYTKWDSQNNINTEYSYESSFEYNTSNYPISEQRIYLNGNTKEFTYEYY